MTQYDFLIVGAGPAGCLSAELLARSGARVALFDGRPEGEPKACGGGVTAKVLKAWPQLCNAACRWITQLEMCSPSGKRLQLQLDEPLAIFSRTAFDRYLRDQAQAAGADIIRKEIPTNGFKRVEQRWTLRSRNHEEWSGRFLVGADGASSRIARMLVGPIPNAEMSIAFGYRAPLPKTKEPSTVLAFLPGRPGYAWAFPRVDHISFGIAISQTNFDHARLNELLWNFMISYYEGLQHELFRPGYSESIRRNFNDWFEPYAARVPQLSAGTLRSRSISGKDWALLGDAAGFVDPITDEGIYFALRSAQLFAEAHLEDRSDSYENRCRFDFGYQLTRASNLRARFYGSLGRSPLTEKMIQLASINPGIKTTLCHLVSGRQQYVGLRRALLRNALRL